MNDMKSAIEAKSDQLNSSDLVSGPITVTISRVTIASGEQPVSVFYAGDNGKPYKPCKSMARVMVHAWGADANNYSGRSMTLYRDQNVKWGGMAIGGIRISHMSHVAGPITMSLAVTKGKWAPYSVQPLRENPQTQAGGDSSAADAAASLGMAAYEAFYKGLGTEDRKALLPGHESRKASARKADAEKAIQEGEA